MINIFVGFYKVNLVMYFIKCFSVITKNIQLLNTNTKQSLGLFNPHLYGSG